MHLRVREDSEPLSLIKEDECVQPCFTVRGKDSTEMRDDLTEISRIVKPKGKTTKNTGLSSKRYLCNTLTFSSFIAL